MIGVRVLDGWYVVHRIVADPKSMKRNDILLGSVIGIVRDVLAGIHIGYAYSCAMRKYN